MSIRLNIYAVIITAIFLVACNQQTVQEANTPETKVVEAPSAETSNNTGYVEIPMTQPKATYKTAP